MLLIFKVKNLTVLFIRQKAVLWLSLKFSEFVKNFFLQCEPSFPCLCFSSCDFCYPEIDSSVERIFKLHCCCLLSAL